MAGYALASVSGQPVSGIWPIPKDEVCPDRIDEWLTVSDIHEALEIMRNRGSQVLLMDGEEVQTVTTRGTQSILVDPSVPKSAYGNPSRSPGLGSEWCRTPFWLERLTPNPTATYQFYAECFGLEAVNHDDECWTIKIPGAEADPSGFSFPKDPEFAECTLLVSILTGDLENAVNLIKGSGGSTDEPFTDMGEMGRFTYASTPKGVPYGLWEAAFSAND